MPLDLSATSRHLAGTDQPAPVNGFVCPACGQENAGAVGTPCSHCGSGELGRHVGVDPRPVPSTAQMLLDAASTPVPEDLDRIFLQWAKDRQLSDVVATLCYDACKTGWLAAKGLLMAPGFLLMGTQRSRTIVAALDFFLTNLHRDDLEEVTTGEWLPRADIQELIEQLTRESHD